jgi:signal transduction histidine kinase
MSDVRNGPPGVFSTPVLRRLLLIFLPIALLTGSVVLALYWQERVADRDLHEQAGTHLVDLHTAIIDREGKAVKSELLYLAGQSALRRYLAGDPASREELEREYKEFCWRRGVYDQIRYLDITGRERVRINFNDGQPAIVPDDKLQPKADRYYFREAKELDRDQVFVSPFDLNVEHTEIERPLKPTVRFATPVFDDSGSKRGVLVLNYLGAALLGKLAEVSGTFPGTALLLNRQGYYLRGPTADDEWGFMLGHERTFALQHPEAWSHISTGTEGQFLTDDGLFTYRNLEPRPASGPEGRDAGLIVVAHTPPAVLQGRSAQLLRRLLLLYAVVLVVLLLLAWYLAYVGTLRRDHEQRLAESEARLRTLSAQLMTAQEEERRGISRDLHDELGQVVTSMTLDLQRAGQATDTARKDELIGRALVGAGRLLDGIHEIAARIRPPMLDDLGLKDAVQSLLSDYEWRSGVAATLDLRFEHDAVPAAVSENIYRILQEALTNVARHAQAKEVRVSLHVAPDQVALSVRDAGVGFDPAGQDGKRLGLLGMRERAELLGGTFAVSAQPGRGTEIRVTLPLAEPRLP